MKLPLLALAVLSGVLSGNLGAVPDTPASDEAALDAEIARLERELEKELASSAWELNGEIEVGAGYRSNPELVPSNTADSRFVHDDSAVVRASANVFAWRLPSDGFEWTNMVDATTSHYFDDDIDDAWMVMARSQARWQRGAAGQISVAGQYIYHDEVIDASSLDSDYGSAARVRLQSPAIEAGYEHRFGRAWLGGAKLRVEYSDFEFPFDDFRTYEAEVSVRRSSDRIGAFSARAMFSLRDYLTRPQSEVGGRDLPGTHLEVARPGIEIRHELRGGENVEWRSRLKAGYRRNDDNGRGWYDYDLYSSGLVFTLDGGNWRMDTDVGWMRYDYRVQRVGFGNPPRRKTDDWSLNARFERDLGETWCAFLELELARSRSNDPFVTYDDDLFLLGLRWNS